MATNQRFGWIAATTVLAAGLVLCGCSGAPAPHSTSATGESASEVNPAGDIPDTQAFVAFTSPDGTYTVSVPEGWARSTEGSATVFTDKTITVRVESGTQPTAPTGESVTSIVLPALAASTAGYRPGSVSVVQRAAGTAVLVTYQATGAPSPVTTQTVTEEVQRYEFWHAGHTATLTLAAPAGADNVDSWKTITDSLRWR